MLIRLLIAIVFFIPAFFLTMRYNLHMFQLNGYKNGEHIDWLKLHWKQQWLLCLAGVLGILRIFLTHVVVDIFGFITFALIIPVYLAFKKSNTKKKLVYTARVKRLIATDVVLSLLCVALVAILDGISRLPGVFLILVALQIVMLVCDNVINHPIENGINQYYIKDAQKKLQEVPGLVIIGVTGSYGKTSVKFYLQTLLQERFNVLVTPESYNTPMGVVRTIRESLQSTHEIFICEMGARHVGDIKEICDIVHPRHGVITSIGPQHLQTFFNMENIKNTKFELADALPEGGFLFLNGDNEYIREKAGEYPDKIFYFSEADGKGYKATDIKVSNLGTEFTVVTPEGESQSYQTSLIGAHNVINIVGAIAVAHKLGISLKELRVPVRKIRPVEHRLQLREHGEVTIIDDAYNSNPVGSKVAVETLALFDGIKILITPGMVELGDAEDEYNFKFGTYAADCCDYILLVGHKTTKAIREGVLSKNFPEEKCIVYDKLEEAMSYAYSIKGQGHKYILLENDLPDNY